MSYSAIISFKKIEADKVYSFLVELKQEIIKDLDGIAKEEFMFSPYARKTNCSEEELRNWALRLFSYRWFYLPQQQLLGIFGLPTAQAQLLFDSTLHFQNSVDQDYDFDYWNGVDFFEEIAKGWQEAPEDAVKLKYKAKNHEEFSGDQKRLDYYRKTFCYDEIWGHLEDFLMNDNSAIYYSVFSSWYEIYLVQQFTDAVKKHYDNWEDEHGIRRTRI